MNTPSILAGTATRKVASKGIMLAMGAVLGGAFAAGALALVVLVTDEWKEQNQMAWVQAMNSIYNRAEENVIHELVLQ